ncbi:MAG: hypothetical protein WA058_03235 [Minisyncoccia bacterium]
MEDEKTLPVGEPGIEVTALPVLRTPIEPTPAAIPVMPAYVPPAAEVSSEPVQPLRGVPSPKQQQWGVLISIVVIVMMVIVGAFYAWGQRIAQNQYPSTVTE